MLGGHSLSCIHGSSSSLTFASRCGLSLSLSPVSLSILNVCTVCTCTSKHICPLCESLGVVLISCLVSLVHRSYLEHLRETFGDRGPPPAFPLPGAAPTTAAAATTTTTAGREAPPSRPAGRGEWGPGAGDGGESAPCLVRVRVGNVSLEATPASSGEALCRGLLVRGKLE